MINPVSRLAMLIFIVAYPLQALSEYVFTAPPRESVEKGIEIYSPVTDFLTKVTGEKFVYRHPQSWPEYSRAMKNNEYDLVFDGPHFVSWRVEYLNHDVLAKIAKLHIWRIIVTKDNTTIKTMDDLVGRTICAPKSPNFGMLTMMSHFPNPDREPVHVVTKGWKDGFNGVIQGKCEVAVLPIINHKKFDPLLEKTRTIHTHLPYPNQAFTSSTRITPNLKSKIASSLLSNEGQQAMSKLRDRFAKGEKIVSAVSEEYEGISMVLKRAENFGSTVAKAN